MMAFGADGTWIAGDCSKPNYGCRIARDIDGKRTCFDACLLWELEQLWKQGIETECSCCGHGEREPKIGVYDEASANKMRMLGYIDTTPLFDGCELCAPIWFRAKSLLNCEKGAKYNV